MKIDVAYDDRLLGWKGSAASPVRAKNAVDLLGAYRPDIDVRTISGLASVDDLNFVHSPAYVADVLAGASGEWRGADTYQADVARLMFQGTVNLVARMPADRSEAWVGFTPQGAKHHAHWNYSSGFCVFNDFAWAAKTLTARGERVLYVDFDAHHGDGVEALTYHDDHIMTASIHEGGIFPGSGWHNAPQREVWNFPLDAASGDVALLTAINDVLELAHGFRPTVILVAAGADGHEDDPLSSLRYTLEGYTEVATRLATFASESGAVRVLIGGAGGYRPDDVTPAVWSTFVDTFATALEEAVAQIDVHQS